MDNELLLTENEGLIYSMISRFLPYYDKDDLVQVARMGLLKAAETFDDSYNTKFSTYAYMSILGEILKFTREDKNIKISKDILKLSRGIDKAREVLAQKLMRMPSVVELSLFLEIDETQIMQADLSKEFVLSLDSSLNGDDDGKELNMYDSVPFEEKGYQAEVLDLHQELDRLPEQERKLIEIRYFQDKTQSETSAVMGMSQVQVSRSETKILTKLYQKLAA